MANLSSTHRHDYRWPGETCVVPRAEVPSDHCDKSPGAWGDRNSGKAELPWCGRNRPLSTQASQPTDRVCNDLVPTVEDRPWCQRGLLVDQISNHKQNPPQVQLTLLPPNCLVQPLISTQKCCERGDAVVPARVGAAPQQDTSYYDQPNLYLKKLCDKFPQPTAVIVATPREELTRRVYADRYRTTYQTDYCKNADDSARCKAARCDSSMATASSSKVRSLDVQCKCGCKTQPPTSTTTQVSPPACRPAAISQNVHFSCCTVKKKTEQSSNAEESGPSEKMPPWASEYSSGIGRTAQIIMEQKLLYTKKKKQRLC